MNEEEIRKRVNEIAREVISNESFTTQEETYEMLDEMEKLTELKRKEQRKQELIDRYKNKILLTDTNITEGFKR